VLDVIIQKDKNMKLQEIFRKPVDRPIEGVIKADDESSLQLEIDEYVLTNEIAKRLENFLDAYNNYQGANGVWISGFFGSGKSHLLKILSLVLENRLVSDTPALDLFLLKCGDNEILRGDLKRAVAIPSASILFNIDQKADVISKTQIDALLSVFVKVFDEHCGYYGKQGHIARFERDLDRRGQYEAFREKYREISGLPWEEGREQALLEGENISAAYAAITGVARESVADILDRYRSDYRVSIEDFANQVNDYIKTRPTGFRLNFFVDEVGQYIADNIKLMTNLQTIAESLATKCRGQAWIIVTAQEEMSTVVGEMTQQHGNDFSKIQARFANRMKLTSANVAEVIQRRLLEKNETGVAVLSDIYHREANNLKTLFDFVDGAQTYRNFRDRDHFIHAYPFIPYQFDLFQKAIQNLSVHDAFEGRHSSVGERSMLGVFREVAIQILEHEIGRLATFDLMFAGLRTALKTQIQQSIRLAEDNLDNPFAVRLLKALFLVKYIKDFRATAKNLRILMLDGFNADIKSLTRQVEEALELLEQQTYIQRHGDEYEFLTNEEKDVESEIKATEIDLSEAADELAKIAFDQILKIQKVNYDTNGQNYPFCRKLDDQLYGREQELAIHLISFFNDNDEETIRARAGVRNELLVILPPDKRLMDDLVLLKKTDKYIRQNVTTTQKESINRILTEKANRNRERQQDLQEQISSLLGRARLYIAGQEVEESAEDPRTRIINACQKLIAKTYPNLIMLPGISYTEKDILSILRAKQPALSGLSEAEQEMLSFIQNNQSNGIRTTVKVLVDRFESNPYGWYLMAVICTLAKLCSRDKIEVQLDGTPLDDAELEKALRNTRLHANLILKPQVEFSIAQIRALKDFFNEFFERPPQHQEARSLARETDDALRGLQQSLKDYLRQSTDYPFLQSLEPPLNTISELTGRPHSFYLTDLIRQQDDLLALKEEKIDPSVSFMTGSRRRIYDDIREFLRTENANFHYLGDDTPNRLKEILDNPLDYRDNSFQEARILLEETRQKLRKLVAGEREKARQQLDAWENQVADLPEFSNVPDALREEIRKIFSQTRKSLDKQNLIAVINDTIHHFEERRYPDCLNRIISWQPEPSVYPPGKPPKLPPVVAERIVEPISKTINQIEFDKPMLADEQDVELYLERLKKAMLEEVRNGKKIQV